MFNSFFLSKKVKDSLIIMGVGLIFGVAYPLLNPDDDLSSVFNGLIIGLTGSGFIALNEVIYKPKFLRYLKFTLVVIYKSIIYTTFFIISIPIVVSVTRAKLLGISLGTFIEDGGLNHFIYEEDFQAIISYALVATVLFIFTYQMSRKMGQGIMWSFISGKYHHPKEEERIFLFMDLKGSTTIAEELGDLDYNKFLNKFFFDITDSILDNYGKIYRYVGDEVVISWKMKKGLKNSTFINTFFDAQKAIELNKNKYLKKYGVAPAFTASYNYGKVIIGELGEFKSQISFLGNVMYETAAIEKSCGELKSDILISDKLLKLVDLPKKYKVTSKGVVHPVGLKPLTVSFIEKKK